MKIAVPTINGKFSEHFGQSNCFSLFTYDDTAQRVKKCEMYDTPAHRPGSLPMWLIENKVEVVLAGGMGQRAKNMLENNGIKVVTGITGGEPLQMIKDFVADKLEYSDEVCSHHQHAHDGEHNCHH